MKTITAGEATLNLDDDLLETAKRLTGIQSRTALVHEGLRALIARESARRLVQLGGSDPWRQSREKTPAILTVFPARASGPFSRGAAETRGTPFLRASA